MFCVDAWVWWWPDQPGWAQGEVVVTASNPTVTKLLDAVPADFRLQFGDAIRHGAGPARRRTSAARGDPVWRRAGAQFSCRLRMGTSLHHAVGLGECVGDFAVDHRGERSAPARGPMATRRWWLDSPPWRGRASTSPPHAHVCTPGTLAPWGLRRVWASPGPRKIRCSLAPSAWECGWTWRRGRALLRRAGTESSPLPSPRSRWIATLADRSPTARHVGLAPTLELGRLPRSTRQAGDPQTSRRRTVGGEPTKSTCC